MVGNSGSDLDPAPFDPRRLIALVGPTSSGKTALSLELAARLPIELICMDSMQLYAELKVGTARPDARAQQGVRHHLFGAVSVREPMNAQRYAAMASRVIAEIQARGRLPMLVGGTGLYLRALLGGLDALSTTPVALRARLDRLTVRKGRAHLARLLARLDPRGAAHLHPNDHQRIQRFLEVRLLSGRSMLDLWAEATARQVSAATLIGLEVPRAILDERIRGAVAHMLRSGWLAETEGLIEAGLFAHVLEIAPIGYADVADLLAGKSTRDEVSERIYRATRRYAKRQMTWFRKASDIRWFPFDPESGYNITGIIEVVQGNMG